MTADRAWVRRYLDLLQTDHPSPSLEALGRLARAHLLSVTFENVTALLRRRAHLGGPVPPIDPDALLASWEAGRGGGVRRSPSPRASGRGRSWRSRRRRRDGARDGGRGGRPAVAPGRTIAPTVKSAPGRNLVDPTWRDATGASLRPEPWAGIPWVTHRAYGG